MTAMIEREERGNQEAFRSPPSVASQPDNNAGSAARRIDARDPAQHRPSIWHARSGVTGGCFPQRHLNKRLGAEDAHIAKEQVQSAEDRVNGVSFDAGGLIALERSHRRILALVATALEDRRRIVVPATALAQVIEIYFSGTAVSQ